MAAKLTQSATSMSKSFLSFRRILQSQTILVRQTATRSTSCRSRQYGTIRTTCPFATLGLTKSSDPSYAEVKSRFQKLALKHHPDRVASVKSGNGADDESGKKEQRLTREEATSRFVRYRMAFEAIVESDDGSGSAILKEDAEYYKVVSEENAAAKARNAKPGHLHAEPNYDDISHRHVDPQALHELAELAEEVSTSPGGLPKSGFWQYAAYIRDKAQRGDLPPLQVSEGKNASTNKTKTTRRRRRRR